MKITYAVTVCNEFIEIQRLVHHLLKNKRVQDDVVILYDSKNGNPDIETFLRSHSVNGEFMWHRGEFEGHFADWKNRLNGYCTGDYIFQIDADEYLHPDLIKDLPAILETNPDVEVFLVPRVNTVDGLTQEHIDKWGWHVNQDGWVNFPDFQWRVFKNAPHIKWKDKVHESITGFTQYTYLPQQVEYSLFHPKTIQKQEKQNNYYNTL
jgi:hypothetical protein